MWKPIGYLFIFLKDDSYFSKFSEPRMPGQKRKKNYYANAAKKARAHGQGRVLASDMKGFLLTCNNRCYKWQPLESIHW